MKHSLQLKLSQHLTLTPQLQQSIRLLQLSTVELNQELERYLAENPLLERSDLGPPDEQRAAPPNGAEAAEGETLRQEETREEIRREDSREQPSQFADEHGVGARDVAECLELQLRALPEDTAHRDSAIALVTRHLDVLAARDFNRLKRLLGVSEDELRDVRSLILTLDPKPGRAFGQGDVRYVIPDVVVRKTGGRWIAALNRDAMPRLRINKMYADILQASRENGGKHLSGQLQEARWLIKNVQQRFDTILRVTQAIVDRQKNFFEHGEVAMRPLVLREIAEAVGLHESTISRVTTQKYMLTPRGIFELKYFFGSHVSTDTGGACSATAIRALIKQLVTAEDGRKPLSDHRISDILAQQGIQVARRTVAKYREAMHIQPANLRKSI